MMDGYTVDETGAILFRDLAGSTFIGLNDTPGAYVASQVLAVNAAATAVLFASNLYWIEATGRLGIGAPAPGATLEVNGDILQASIGDKLYRDASYYFSCIESFTDGDFGPVISVADSSGRNFRVKNASNDYLMVIEGDRGDVCIGGNHPSTIRLHVIDESASTGAIIPVARLESQVDGGAGAAGHGPSLEWHGETSTTEDQFMCEVAARWSVATHASRRSRAEVRLAYQAGSLLVGVVECAAFATVDGNARGVGAVEVMTYRAAAAQVASGIHSTLLGGQSGTASGNNSVCIGGASNVASSTGAVAMGGSGNTASALGTVAWGVSATSSHAGAYVWSSGAATVSWGATTWTARCHGGARFYSAAGVGTGVQLSAGGNAWAAISARAAKENMRPVNNILSKVAVLPVYNYNLKSQPDTVRHIGSVAEDFNKLFDFTEMEGYINTMDLSGVNLAAIKELLVRIERLEEVMLQ